MFTTLAKSGLARLGLIQPRRIAPGPLQAVFSHHRHLNDNLPGFRRPAAAGKRRAPTPALACHWVLTEANQLECRWSVEDMDGKCAEEPDSLASQEKNRGCFGWRLAV